MPAPALLRLMEVRPVPRRPARSSRVCGPSTSATLQVRHEHIPPTLDPLDALPVGVRPPARRADLDPAGAPAARARRGDPPGGRRHFRPGHPGELKSRGMSARPTSDQLVALKKEGVSDAVLQAMNEAPLRPDREVFVESAWPAPYPYYYYYPYYPGYY